MATLIKVEKSPVWVARLYFSKALAVNSHGRRTGHST
jgi:hypothetical protein